MVAPTSSIACIPLWAAPAPAPASWLAWRALAALSRTVAAISSIVAAVSSSAAAWRPARSDSSWLPRTISPETPARRSASPRIWRTMPTRRSCMRCRASSRWPVSSRPPRGKLAPRSPSATRPASATASRSGAAIRRATHHASSVPPARPAPSSSMVTWRACAQAAPEASTAAALPASSTPTRRSTRPALRKLCSRDSPRSSARAASLSPAADSASTLAAAAS
nr:hypothetical protein [Massilia sp. KIM]